jgi:hypothetical protein
MSERVKTIDKALIF